MSFHPHICRQLFILAGATLLQAADCGAFSQIPDTTARWGDPLTNRLFTMSTGRTMPGGKFSIADFEVFLLQLGYSPADRFQLNFSYILPITGPTETYWSVGTKIEVIPPAGLFQGVSVGADLGFFSRLLEVSSTSSSDRLTSVNIAASAGIERAKIHLSLAQLQFSSWQGNLPVPTYVQLGGELTLQSDPAGGGSKFIIESMWARSHERLSPTLLLVGFRVFGRNSAGEFSWPFASIFTSNSDELRAQSLPLVSVTVLF